MMVDTKPTARVIFKKNFDEPIYLKHLRAEHYVLKNSTSS